ncbi:MAG TPA: hypothetical protein VFQ72_02025 [Candidatus Paceibacterota bacterium]|nr:hypothetical protein [Candidatus Paceibacterota bacterium]
MKKTFAAVAFSLYLALGFAAAASAQVDTNYIPLTTVPGAFEAGKITNPVKVVAGVYGIAIGIGSIIAVVMIILAGFKYMYQESIDGKSDAKEQITNAFIGLFVILGSYIILKTINPALVDFDVELRGGSGKVSGLIAIQKELDATQSKVAQANAATAERQKEIDALKTTTLPNKEKEIQAMKDRIAAAEKTAGGPGKKAVLDELNGQLAKLEGEKAQILDTISIKTIDNLKTIAQNNVTLGRDNVFKNEITSLTKITDPTQASVEARESLRRLAVQTDSLKLAMEKKIAEAETIDVAIGSKSEVAKQEYFNAANQDLTYINQSKSLITEAHDTINANSGGTDKQNSEYNALLSKYAGYVKELQDSNRKDLADRLQTDIDSVTKIMKIRQAVNCATYDAARRQQLTLCQP